MSRIAPFQPTSSNIAITPNFTAVPTTTGLAQGDMVFWKTGDYQPFSAQVSTATFPLTADVPAIYGFTGGNGGQINSNLTTTSPSGGNSNARNVALLTNGNIVVASINASGVAYFTIYDTSFNVVVSRVTLPATFTAGNNTAGVTALSGGGFVIYYARSTGTFCYAVYTNTGTVTTALSENTTSTANNSFPYTVTALSGGGFTAVAVSSGTTNIFYMIFNASGTQTFSATGQGAAYSTSVIPTVVADSNNTFFMLWLGTTNNYSWLHKSAANATLGSGTIACSSVTRLASCTATLLNSGTTIVVVYGTNATGSYGIRQYNSSTYAMGAETLYTAPSSGDLINSFYAKTLASGNVFLCMTQPYVTYYALFNSSMTPLISSLTTTTSPVYKSFSTNYNEISNVPWLSSNMSAIEIGSSLYLFYSSYFNIGDGTQMYAAIDTSAYNLTSSLPVNTSVGTITLPIGSYVPSTLTPSTVSFYPASTTGSIYGPTGASAGSATLVNGNFTSSNYDICALPNGSFVIAYRDESTYIVYAKVYSSAGTALSTVTIGTSTATSQINSVKVAPLAGGKFVVVWANTSTTITSSVVSSSYTISGNTVETSVDNSSSAGQNKIAVGTLSNDRFVVAWTTSGSQYYYAKVYDANVNQLSYITTTTTGNVSAVSGFPSGGFVLSNDSVMYVYQETTANTFSILSSTSISVFNNPYIRTNLTPRGQIIAYTPYNQWNGSVTNYVLRYNVSTRAAGGLVNDIQRATTPVNQTPMIGAESANGTFATLTLSNTNGTLLAKNLTTTVNIPAQNAQPAFICPTIDEKFVVLYRNATTAYLTFNIPFATNTLTSVVTVGVTPSSTVSLTTGTYGFVGVAANTVAANGVSIVQTNGMAKLNSTYSASVPGTSFNARAAANPGVSGTINGRNMVLYGSAITGTT